jgi:uncharacterized protein YcaQ
MEEMPLKGIASEVITAGEARAFLVGHLGLRALSERRGQEGVRALLQTLRCIQLDPLDRVGTNADLVAWARVEGLKRGDVYTHLMPGHGFEHFAKERCLLPVEAFPYYRGQAVETPWWRHSERMKRLSPALLGAVLEEVTRRGPLTADDLTDQGRVEAMDWSGWSGTKRASSLALEVLWTRCEVVVAGRRGRRKLYDIPARALGQGASQQPALPFAHWALRERVEAAGLLSMSAGPHWSMLSAVRTGPLPAQLVAAGHLKVVTVQGAPRRYLVPADWRARTHPEDDGRMRVIAPLDPLIWDRQLVKHAFGFDYVWEVYKPAAQRRWGYYVCPLLLEGRVVGRFEGRRTPAGALEILRLDRLEGFSEAAWARAFARLEAAQ